MNVYVPVPWVHTGARQSAEFGETFPFIATILIIVALFFPNGTVFKYNRGD